ncbi:MAG: alpha-L-fucosidase [Gemmatimonadota bacterium]|nr:alpha-L-fucosidase [Gemmatimonadota bacterium]
MKRRNFVAAGAYGLGAMALNPLLRMHGEGGGMWATTVFHPAAERMAWWREARFGLFLHWGLYSILAGEWMGRTDYAEWIRNNAHIPIDTYDRLVGRFNPVKFDADAWAGMAKGAGMKYVTLTTKHHDGFCLFDNPLTDFCVRSTPFRRDICTELNAATERAGLRQCWYHSIMDWHHFEYLPRRDWEAETRAVGGAHIANYLPYLHGSVRHLLTKYGDIGVMWFDGNWEGTWTHDMGMELYDVCRQAKPDVIVNNRTEGWSQSVATRHPGDFSTPEQTIPATGLPGVDWESCITMNHNWGYNAHDHDFKSVPELIGMLVDTASKGGNLLLNVGPMADGTFPAESVDRLAGMGKWMQVNGDAIHGTTASLFAKSPFRSTTKGNRINLFVTDWPADGALPLPGLRTRPRSVSLAAQPDRHPTLNTDATGAMGLTALGAAPDPVCSVIVLDFDRPPVVGA